MPCMSIDINVLHEKIENCSLLCARNMPIKVLLEHASQCLQAAPSVPSLQTQGALLIKQMQDRKLAI